MHIPGIVHLLTSTRTSYVVTGGSRFIDDLIDQVKIVLIESRFDVGFVRLPSLKDVLPSLNQSKAQAVHDPFPTIQSFTDKSIVLILHSSGSTSLPKALKYHLEAMYKNIIYQRKSTYTFQEWRCKLTNYAHYSNRVDVCAPWS